MGRKAKPVPQQSNHSYSAGARLRLARESRKPKISLTNMANALHYSVGYLSGVETGKHEVTEKLVGEYEEQLGLELNELSEFIQTPQKVEPVLKKSGRWYVPQLRNPFFTGRDTLLEEIRKRLWSSRVMSYALAFVGLSGVGKTQLALEYAYRYGGEYQAVFWLHANSDATLTNSCVAIAKYLDLPQKDIQDQQKIVDVVQHQIKDLSGSLIIIDDVEDLAPLHDFLPQLGENHIIITTRMQAVGILAQTIELRELNVDESMLLLLRRAKVILSGVPLSNVSEATLGPAKELSEKMAGLPIALDQAGSYIEETGCGLRGYLDLLKTQMPEQNNQSSFLYPLVAYNAWLFSFNEVRKINFAASELLYLCAFLGTDRIYLNFFLDAGLSVGSTIYSLTQNLFTLHQTMKMLRKYSLVQTDAESSALFVHPLVQAAIRDSLDLTTRQQWAECAVKVTNQAFPTIPIENRREAWEKCQCYSAQARACVALIDEWKMKGEEVTQLLRKVGKYLEERSELKGAEEMYQRALSLDRQLYGERHLTVATDLGNLAMLYEKRNDAHSLQIADECYEQAIFIRDQMGKLENLDLTMLRACVRLLRRAKQNDRARELYQLLNASETDQKQRIKRIPVNDDDEKIDYQRKADWSYTIRRDTGDFNDDIHSTSTKGASFEYHFEGIGIEIISDTRYNHGEINIYIDDIYIRTINTSLLPNKMTQTIVFTETNLNFGLHKLKVVLVNGTLILDALAFFSYEEDEIDN